MGFIIGIIAALFILPKLIPNLSSILPSGLSLGTSPTVPVGQTAAAPSPVIVGGAPTVLPQITNSFNITAGATKVATSGLATGLISSGAIAAGSIAASAIPIAGAVISVVLSAFEAASQKRAKAAINENQAVDAFVTGSSVPPGYDAMMAEVNNDYNAGNLTAANCTTAFNQIMAAYWSEVGPQIQSGRNGCNSGQVPWRGNANNQDCAGDWGAACCIGYADLQAGINNCITAIQTTEQSGAPTPALIPTIYPSKYSTLSRTGYTLTWTRPA